MFLKKNLDKLKQFIPKFLKKGYNVNILHNCFILYFMLFLSTINLVSYGLMGNYHVPLLFFIIGITTSCFSKNMIVILTTSLICSHLMRSVRFYEGMEDMDSTKENDNKGIEKTEQDEKKEKEKEKEKGVQGYDEKNMETKVHIEKIEGMQQQYKELMTLQDRILGNIGTLEESLSNAEGLVKKIGNSIESK